MATAMKKPMKKPMKKMMKESSKAEKAMDKKEMMGSSKMKKGAKCGY
jgi:hypothetical protein